MWGREIVPHAPVVSPLPPSANHTEPFTPRKIKSKDLSQCGTRGNFYFNPPPLDPLGNKVIVNEKPGQRKSWDPHGVEG